MTDASLFDVVRPLCGRGKPALPLCKVPLVAVVSGDLAFHKPVPP